MTSSGVVAKRAQAALGYPNRLAAGKDRATMLRGLTKASERAEINFLQ
ncbi:MAG TPA: hypothetical protein VMV93_15160 [Chloroflexota bacterium]|nr:hypothetical protein [Chloroflexota bacterium]